MNYKILEHSKTNAFSMETTTDTGSTKPFLDRAGFQQKNTIFFKYQNLPDEKETVKLKISS